ncbi:MAG: enoyl-CoA hydratase/isomerase family protein [Pseudomonadota bacterium]
MAEPANDEPMTLIRVEGRAGRITLNRPRQINALAYEQVAPIHDALTAWADDPDVKLVILDGAGDRGLCAGGDVLHLYHARDTEPELAERFWRDEYALNSAIHRYPKPFVAIMDGIVMGGGIGLSGHASHRVVTERSKLAMPETTIGLIPDVGGTWLLAHAPGEMGLYLGLLGERMGAADAIYAGFADTHVPSEELPGLIAELTSPDGDPAGTAIAEVATAPPEALHALRQDAIDRMFGHADLASVITALSAPDAPDWAGWALETIEAKSPLAMQLTFESIRNAGAQPSLEDALAVEYRLANRLYQHGEFVEGIRALLVDKDKSPKWAHGSAADVPADMVAQWMAPGPDVSELGLKPPANVDRRVAGTDA